MGGNNQALNEICPNNKLLERVTSVTLDISYLLHLTHVPNKATKSIKILGIITSIIKPMFLQNHTRIKICKTLARPILAYGWEARTIHQKFLQKIVQCMCNASHIHKLRVLRVTIFKRRIIFFNTIAAAETLASNLIFFSFRLSDRSAWGRWNGSSHSCFRRGYSVWNYYLNLPSCFGMVYREIRK